MGLHPRVAIARLGLGLGLGLLTATAEAAPHLEVIDRGDAIEIIAHDVRAQRAKARSLRQRIEVPIVGRPQVRKVAPSDPLIMYAEIVPGEPRMLSIKLDADFSTTRGYAPHVRVEQVGDDLRVMIPRELPVGAGVIALPAWTPTDVAAPTVPAPAAAPTAADMGSPEHVPVPDSIVAVAPIDNPGADADATVALTDRAPAPPEASPARTPAAADTPPTATMRGIGGADESSIGSLQVLGLIGLAAIGLATWLLRRRRPLKAVGPTIEVVAQRGLGGKVQVVWLAAGEREMVVAVTPQQVRMLGQWRRPAVEAATTPRPPTELPSRPASPAVDGILRLRARVSASPLPITDDDDGDTDDAIWARELLAATGRPPRKRPG